MKRMEKKLRAVIYTRVSTRDQARDGYSLSAQCILKEYEIVEIYTDEGISGKSIKNRPGLLKMLSGIHENKYNVIVIWRISRFARNMTEFLQICDLLETNGIFLASCSEDFDSSTSIGKLIRNILGSFAEYERNIISENVSLALYERFTQGRRTCTQILGYHVEKDILIPIPEELEIVKYIFKEYINARNFSVVARMCNDRNYKGKRGASFSCVTIKTVLTSSVYAGYNKFSGEFFKGDNEAIIPPKEWNEVQRIIMNRNIGRKRKKQLNLIQSH